LDIRTSPPQAAAGANHTLIIDSSRTLWSFGQNHNGQLGNGTTDNGTATPYKVADDAIGVWDEGDSSMYLSAAGRLHVFGYGPWPQTGTEEGTYKPKISTPLPFPMVHDGEELVIRNAALGTAQASILAIDTQNRLWAFGLDSEGSLGLGYDQAGGVAWKPTLVATGVAQVSMSVHHSLILKTDGSVWAAGSDDSTIEPTYRLGIGTSGSHTSWQRVADDAVDIRAAEYHSLVLKRDGSVWFFGLNAFGQSGKDPEQAPFHAIPFRIASGATAIAADSRYSILVAGEELVAFGELPFEYDAAEPFSASVPGRIADLETGPFHFVFSVAGSAWWGGGTNDAGQLMELPNAARPSPLGPVP
jgi:alpha-tubulin suppressor-like RCC1 family protein